MKLLCKLFGHRWVIIEWTIGPLGYSANLALCNRCRDTGNFDEWHAAKER